jgi:hypothetical protein
LIDAARAVLDCDQRLRRERFEPGRELGGPIGESSAGVNMRQHPSQLDDLLLQLQLAGLRLFRNALEPSLDVIPIGDQQLEPPSL